MPLARGRARPVPIEDRAADDLRFIRHTLERSATFTAVPGVGGAVMGVLGVAGALVAAQTTSPDAWLGVWIGTAVLAVTVGLIAMHRKANRAGEPLGGAAARQFALSFGAPVLAATLLTTGAREMGAWSLIPPLWLLLYGTAVVGGGAFSVPAVRLLGLAFLFLGVMALLTPPSWGNAWLGIGFGGLQIAVGLYIARVNGG